ncbi:transcription termination factor Rho [Haloferula sp. A504]|uniref:transcription termination factor Rho n=1 Tax=Haloferula sp. A504 TaxID=3373601 RepID=UPI0031BCCE0B|nr:transcription termination factor Rho [Verrucomicrobiaceae bacterium E54]
MALTGGVASGKSTACAIFRELCSDLVLFEADASVHRLLASDPGVEAAVVGRFGAECRAPGGGIDRPVLRERVFGDEAARRDLEGILHPRVREECLESLARARKIGASLFLADIPLLFENDFDFGQETSLLIAVGRDTQLKRLRDRNGFDDDLARSILDAQMPTADKMRRADVVFWNEGSPELLRAQVRRFLHTHSNMSEPTPDTPAAEAPPTSVIDINEFRARSLAELQAMAEAVPGRMTASPTKAQLIFELLSFHAREGAELIGEGVVEQAKENYAMLRDPARSFRTSPDDLHINGNLLRDYGIKPGHRVKVLVRSPRERDKFLSAVEVLEIEGVPASEFEPGKDFDKLTPLFPDERLILEGEGPAGLSPRAIDLIAPLGKGQRGLIVAPPRGGKTILLKQIAKAIHENHKEVELIVVLLDERPEEVTDFEETVGATVYASTFDEAPKRHAQVADLVIERAQRLVEQGRDVVLLLDSLTRLARGHNSANKGGPIGSGGISPAALQKSRKFFGNARNVEDGGSLTILATALVETESRMDDVIFEEFKGTGNMEVRLDRELAERRIYPAIHIPQSGTRNDDRLYHADEFPKVLDLRRQLAGLPVGEAIETLMKNLGTTQNNTELLLRGLR